MSELKPCPYCGGKAESRIHGQFYKMVCQKCNAQTDEQPTYSLAGDLWNSRNHADADEKIAELQNEITLLKMSLDNRNSDINKLSDLVIERTSQRDNAWVEIGVLSMKIADLELDAKRYRIGKGKDGYWLYIDSKNAAFSLQSGTQERTIFTKILDECATIDAAMGDKDAT